MLFLNYIKQRRKLWNVCCQTIPEWQGNILRSVGVGLCRILPSRWWSWSGSEMLFAAGLVSATTLFFCDFGETRLKRCGRSAHIFLSLLSPKSQKNKVVSDTSPAAKSISDPDQDHHREGSIWHSPTPTLLIPCHYDIMTADVTKFYPLL